MRLIDADALYFAQRYARVDPDSDRLTPVLAVDKYQIEHIPTIDAVHVVRCRDCKHKYNPDSPDWLWCYFVDTNGDDFCSYGKRKDGGGSDTISGQTAADSL